MKKNIVISNDSMGQLNPQLSTEKGITFTRKISFKNYSSKNKDAFVPISTFIEMPLAAANHIYKSQNIIISQMIFNRPLLILDDKVEIHNTIEDNPWEKVFVTYIMDNDERKIYCNGAINVDSNILENRLDIDNIKDDLIRINKEDFRDSIVDLIINLCSQLFDINLNNNYVDSIEKIEIQNQFQNPCYIYAKQIGEKFNISLLDKSGNLCIKITEISFIDISTVQKKINHNLMWKEIPISHKDLLENGMHSGYGSEKFDDKHISNIYLLYYNSSQSLKDQVKNCLMHNHVNEIELTETESHHDQLKSIHEPDIIYLICSSFDQQNQNDLNIEDHFNELLLIIEKLKLILRNQVNKKIIELKIISTNIYSGENFPIYLADFLYKAKKDLFEMKISFYDLDYKDLVYIPGKTNNSMLQFLTEDHKQNENTLMVLRNDKIFIPHLVPSSNDKVKNSESLSNILNIDINYNSEFLPTIIDSYIDKINISTETSIDQDFFKKQQKGYSLFINYIRLSLLKYFHNKKTFIYPDAMYETGRLMETLNIVPKYGKLFEEILHIMKDEGYLNISKGRIITSSNINNDKLRKDINNLENTERMIYDKFPNLKIEFQKIKKYIDNLDDIFSGKFLELNENILKENTNYYYNLLAEAIKQYATKIMEVHEYNDIKIIELGAGVGDTSEIILDQLAEFVKIKKYSYTDSSTDCLTSGKEKFSQKYPFMHFKILNIEEDILKQNYIKGSYDIVIASNVLHRAQNINEALQNIKNLIRKNGLLIINEITSINDIIKIHYGSKYDVSDYYNRMSCTPFIGIDRWKELLDFNGFNKYKVVGNNEISGAIMNRDVIMAESDGVIKYESQ